MVKLGAKLGGKLAKQYARNEILVPHLNNWFGRAKFPDVIEFAIHPNKEVDAAYHPSSATKCARVLFAERRGDLAGEKPSTDAHKNFMVGHYYHAIIQLAVQELGFSQEKDIEWEFNMYEPVWVRGFVDIAECHVPGQDYPLLVDIKTQMARMFAMEPSSELLYKYRTQVQIYLYFKQLTEAIIVWAEKDTPHRFKETNIKSDDGYVESIIERWMEVDTALKADMPPPCSCGKYNQCPGFGIYP